jgi:hypothetical protein
MNRDEITNAVALASDADTSHEDARDWYAAYGAHVSTRDAGDVTHDAVKYDWLDSPDEEVVAQLMASDDRLTHGEAEALVGLARDIRVAAESVCDLLDDAEAAYDAGDLDACKEALLSAYSQESDHGDEPATQSLASEILI